VYNDFFYVPSAIKNYFYNIYTHRDQDLKQKKERKRGEKEKAKE